MDPAGADGDDALDDDDDDNEPAEMAVCAFVASNQNGGSNRGSWKPLQQGWKKKEKKDPRRIGNPPLSFGEFIQAHPQGCFVCYGRNKGFHRDHQTCPIHQVDTEAYNTVADCLSRWAYPASKGMTDVSAHGDEAETAEAKRIIEMERLMEEEGVKCFVVMAADAPLGTRMGRAVRVLAPDGAESDEHLFPESCLQDDWTDDYAKSEAFEAEYRAVTDPDDGQKWPKGLTEEDGKLYRNGKLLVPES